MMKSMRSQRGQSTLEYILVLATIVVAVMAVVGKQIGGDTGAVHLMMGHAAGAMTTASGHVVTDTAVGGAPNRKAPRN